ncbi:MAG: CrcB family protein [Acidimicrobiales bacterium]
MGGIAGATVRWAVLHLTGEATWGLLAVNTAGAFVLGTVVDGILRRRSETQRVMAGVGFCGALTTFSTLAVQVAERFDTGRYDDGVFLVVGSLVLGLGAAGAGLATARWSSE